MAFRKRKFKKKRFARGRNAARGAKRSKGSGPMRIGFRM